MAVTIDDIKAAAHTYLDVRRSVTGYLLPDPTQVARTRNPATPVPVPGGTIH
jgi:hypothetical protein